MMLSILLGACFPDLDREETELELVISGWPAATRRVDVSVRPAVSDVDVRRSFEGDALRRGSVSFELESIPAGLTWVDALAVDDTERALRQVTQMIVLVDGEELTFRLNLAGLTSTTSEDVSTLSIAGREPAPDVLVAEAPFPDVTAEARALGGPATGLEILALELTILPTPEVDELTGIWEGPIVAALTENDRVVELGSTVLDDDAETVTITLDPPDLADWVAPVLAGTARLRISGEPKDEGEVKSARVRVDLRFRLSTSS